MRGFWKKIATAGLACVLTVTAMPFQSFAEGQAGAQTVSQTAVEQENATEQESTAEPSTESVKDSAEAATEQERATETETETATETTTESETAAGQETTTEQGSTAVTTSEQTEAKILEKLQEEKKDTKKYIDGEAIVVFADRTTSDGVDATGLSGDMQVVDSWDFGSQDSSAQVDATGSNGETDASDDVTVALVKSDTLSTDQLISKLKQSKMVESAEPNYICYTDSITNDTYSKWQWGLSNEGQNAGTADDDINVDSVWNSSSVTGSEKIIAIVDTGADYTSSELAPNMWVNPYQGRLAGTYGYDFCNGDSDPMDDNGHGSHCAGIIAAAGNNNSGISGVNQQAKIMAVKFLDDSGSGSLSGAVAAYNYIYRAMKLGANVVAVNNSWGTAESETFEILVNKLGKMGAVSLFAAGNEGQNDDEITDGIWSSDSPYLITVAASNENDALASFSNYGKSSVSLAAPGTDILSTVSYACFNPGIYTQDLRNTLCSNYNDYNEEGSVITDGQSAAEFGAPENTKITGIKTAGSSVSYSSSVVTSKYFGDNGGKALAVSISNAKAGDIVNVAVPYTLPDNLKVSPSISAMVAADGPAATQEIEFWGMKFKIPSYLQVYDFSETEYTQMEASNYQNSESDVAFGIDGEGNYWSHLSMNSGADLSSESGQSRMLVLQVLCEYDGDYTVYLDDLGITKGQDMNEAAQFGNFDYYCGTSMATPFVTGAVALVSALHPECTADEICNMVKASVRKTTEMEGKTVSGGILDLSKLEDPVPLITSAEVQQDNTVKLNGYGFRQDDTVLKINGTEVAGTVVSSRELTFSGADYVDQIVTVSVTTGRGTAEKKLYLVKGKDTYTNLGQIKDSGEVGELLDLDGQTVTDGNTLYYYDSINQALDTFSIEEGAGTLSASSVVAAYFSSMSFFPNTEITDGILGLASNMAYLDGRLYMIASLEELSTTYKEYALVYYDIATMSTGVVGELPDEYDHISEETLAAYNGNLYLLGGYDYNKKALSTLVKRYDPLTAKWTTGSSLPSGRAAGKCIQVGNQLFYTLGEAEQKEGSYTCPSNLLFNGTSWSICDSSTGLTPYTSEIVSHDGKNLTLYSGNMGLVGNDILYSGIPCKGLGDTFTYSISGKSYQKSAYNFITAIDDQSFKGEVVGQYLLGIAADGENQNLYCAKFTNKPYTITDLSTGHGVVTTEAASWLPGSLVTVEATPDTGYYLKAFLVNQAEIKGSSTQFRITANTTVKATFAAYVSKIKLSKSAVQIYSGKTVTLKTTISPSAAGNKEITWKSSNTGYATVDQNGKVTAKKAGIGHAVTITATAKDGSKVRASCKITIIRKVTKVRITANSSAVTVRKPLKLKAVISPSNATIRDVTWKSSNPKYATVDKNGKVTAKKQGIGHQVTITATSKENKKIKATYKITIRS